MVRVILCQIQGTIFKTFQDYPAPPPAYTPGLCIVCYTKGYEERVRKGSNGIYVTSFSCSHLNKECIMMPPPHISLRVLFNFSMRSFLLQNCKLSFNALISTRKLGTKKRVSQCVEPNEKNWIWGFTKKILKNIFLFNPLFTSSYVSLFRAALD